MQRRNFIKQTATAAGALSLPFIGNGAFAATRSSVADAAGQTSGFKKSIMWGTVGLQGSVADKCKAIKAAGFDGIEPNSHMNRSEVIDAMKANGLTASSVCSAGGRSLSDPDAAARQKGIESVRFRRQQACNTIFLLLIIF